MARIYKEKALQQIKKEREVEYDQACTEVLQKYEIMVENLHEFA